MNYQTIPIIPLHDKRFEYRNSEATDVTITWRKFGWLPKGEQDERKDTTRSAASGEYDSALRA